jgi:hypothetical protein
MPRTSTDERAASAASGIELPPRVAEPGVSDDAVQRATGKGWDEWFALLDAWGGTEHTHTEIARHLVEVHGVDGWWAQSVTVGYERARGMRAKYQHADGFSASASKTVPVPVERLFAAFVDDAARDSWLEPGTLRPRTAQPPRSARFDVPANDTRLEVYFTAKGDAKASVQIQHSKLPLEEDVELWRAFWKERLKRLAAMLTEAG